MNIAGIRIITQRSSIKAMFLNVSQNQRKYLCWSFFFIKASYLTQPVNFVESLKTPILKNIFNWLLPWKGNFEETSNQNQILWTLLQCHFHPNISPIIYNIMVSNAVTHSPDTRIIAEMNLEFTEVKLIINNATLAYVYPNTIKTYLTPILLLFVR